MFQNYAHPWPSCAFRPSLCVCVCVSMSVYSSIREKRETKKKKSWTKPFQHTLSYSLTDDRYFSYSCPLYFILFCNFLLKIKSDRLFGVVSNCCFGSLVRDEQEKQLGKKAVKCYTTFRVESERSRLTKAIPLTASN